MQQLTAAIGQVFNRFNCALKIINNDTKKIITNKLEYHKTNLIPHIPTSATTCVQNVNQKPTPLCSAGIGVGRY
jgi:hypothetical protein